MPTGPNLEQISAGQPLVAAKTARNFASLQAFLASIPNDNLLAQYAPYDALRFSQSGETASTTQYLGYMFCGLAEPPGLQTLDLHLLMAADINADAKGVSVQLQYSDTVPNGTAIWVDVAGVHGTMDALTATASNLGGSEYFHTFDLSLTSPIAGRWLRWKVVIGTVAINWIDVVVAAKTRLSQ